MPPKAVRVEDPCEDAASGAMTREAAISGEMTGAEKLWVGDVLLPPGLSSSIHHHGVSESAICIISGPGRFASGDDLSDSQDADPGGFISDRTWRHGDRFFRSLQLSDTSHQFAADSGPSHQRSIASCARNAGYGLLGLAR